jgi:hypothetical protein
MTVQGLVLSAYRCLLWLYPSAFRKRFGTEMLQLAEAMEPTDWPLIFKDTCLGILRAWVQVAAADATLLSAEPVSYLGLGESRLTGLRLVQGFVLSVAILVGAWCVDSVPSLWRFPEYPDCNDIPAKNASLGEDTSSSFRTASRIGKPEIEPNQKSASGRLLASDSLRFQSGSRANQK